MSRVSLAVVADSFPMHQSAELFLYISHAHAATERTCNNKFSFRAHLFLTGYHPI